MNTAIMAVASSGAELPAAINVAPATSDCICKTGMYINRVNFIYT